MVADRALALAVADDEAPFRLSWSRSRDAEVIACLERAAGQSSGRERAAGRALALGAKPACPELSSTWRR